MSREFFGTDGVRGLAGEYPLDEEGARHIGAAVGQYFATSGQGVVIGHDPRESSPKLVRALTDGLNCSGVIVTRVGVIPTPGLAYLTRQHNEFKAGLMVTASHNSYEYNGIKVFGPSGDKLPDESEYILNKLIKERVTGKSSGSVIDKPDMVREYEDFLVDNGHGLNLHSMAVAFDSANGAASGLGQRVFERLGAHVTSLFDHCDGKNINDGCGATDTRVLAERVVKDQLDLGIAVDGDADRLMMVDGHGHVIDGDQLLYILAVSGHHNGVVATVMSNVGLEQALKRHNIRLLRTAVGDRYVLDGLKKSGLTLGGEKSGHIILPELLATGDALLAAVVLLTAIYNSKRDLADWCQEVQLVPQALVNISLPNKTALDNPHVKNFIKKQHEAIDGKGRVLIRPSGTEPLVRVMVEAQQADKLVLDIAEGLERQLMRTNKEGK
jgi:phosphoglucosamine mutase